ncbi:MAG: peroxiredoxin [Alphaproteobacteria bacterium]|nr:MAG: peroxiredoxin [Alphaproteobacteria bacterium]
MTIAVGDRLPQATLRIMGENGPQTITTPEIFAGKKIVLFAVPIPFSPTCHRNHLPGFVEQSETIKARGVDAIAVVAINDVWVMDAWAKASKAEGKILFLADASAEFTKAMGLVATLTPPPGLGLLSKRWSMIVEDGVVRKLNIEEKAGTTEMSGAARILEQL